MPALFSEGFLLGLSTGFYCLAACLPLLAPYVLAEGRRGLASGFFIFLQFTAGRLAAYALFAFLASAAGKAGGGAPPWLLPAAMAACGLLMAGLAAARVGGFSLCLLGRDLGPLAGRLPALMGFVTGINACPPFAAGLLRLLQLADYSRGAVYFGGFFIATTLFTLPVLLGTPWHSPRVAGIGRLTLLLAGAWYAFSGLSYFV